MISFPSPLYHWILTASRGIPGENWAVHSAMTSVLFTESPITFSRMRGLSTKVIEERVRLSIQTARKVLTIMEH